MRRTWTLSLTLALAVADGAHERAAFGLQFKDAGLGFASGQAGSVQEQPLERIVKGDITPGASQVYPIDVRAGDLVLGPLNVQQGAPLRFEVYDPRRTKLKAIALDGTGGTKVGFVAPVAGTYRVQLTARGQMPASFTWKTTVTSPAERMVGRRLDPIVGYKSARITQLEKDVAARVPDALARFWKEIAARGGPIVEPFPRPSIAGPGAGVPGAAGVAPPDEEVLVTFLWRQIYDTYAVEVIRPPYGPVNYRLMTHLPGTDVWYKTMKVHRTSRFMYQLAPNYRGYDEEGDVPLLLDPLNPRVFPEAQDQWIAKPEIEADPAAAWGSVLSLPDAPDESWVRRAPSRRGALIERTFDSPSLKARLSLHIYTPPGYDGSAGPYPVVVLFDGPAYATGLNATPTTLDNLIADRRIRPVIACFISSITDITRNRGANLSNPAFTDAVAMELVPWLRSSYAISTAPKDLVIGGSSAGAVAGARAALAHPDVFGNVLAQSGGAAASDLYVASPRTSVRFYMDIGLYDLTPGELPFDEMLLA